MSANVLHQTFHFLKNNLSHTYNSSAYHMDWRAVHFKIKTFNCLVDSNILLFIKCRKTQQTNKKANQK